MRTLQVRSAAQIRNDSALLEWLKSCHCLFLPYLRSSRIFNFKFPSCHRRHHREIILLSLFYSNFIRIVNFNPIFYNLFSSLRWPLAKARGHQWVRLRPLTDGQDIVECAFAPVTAGPEVREAAWDSAESVKANDRLSRVGFCIVSDLLHRWESVHRNEWTVGNERARNDRHDVGNRCWPPSRKELSSPLSFWCWSQVRQK